MSSKKTKANKAKEADVKSLPSGSGMTFFLDASSASSLDEESSGADESVNVSTILEEDQTEIVNQALKRKHDQDQEDEDTNDESITDESRKELTEKYISGELSFKEFLSQIEPDDDDLSDEDLEDSDEEWVPSGKSSKVAKTKEKPASKKVMAAFADDLQKTTKQQLGRKLARVGVRRGKIKRLDPTLQGLMGEANLNFARGDTETAIKMCMEVIRQDPGAPEPFQSLSTFYEDTGEFEKALQFSLIGAHLAPPDGEEWERLANMSLELGDAKQAASCYKKAIDADTSVIKYHLTRCSLLEELGDKKKALQGYRRLLLVLGPDQAEQYLETAKDIARLLHERGDIDSAKLVIEAAINKHEAAVQSGDVNLLLELLITLQQFEEALEVLCNRCAVKFSSDKTAKELAEVSHQDQLKAFTEASIPEETPYEIRAKLVVVLLNLHAVHLVKKLAAPLVQLDPVEFGDVMLDVAEAYMGEKCFKESLEYLDKLVTTEEYGQAAVWLRYGESLFEVGRLEESEVAYQKVVELAPQHFEARKALSTILHQLGRPDEALHTLTQDEEAELLNPTLLYERCQLLLSENRTEDFVKKAKLLFSRHFVEIRNREETIAVASSKRLSNKKKGLTEVRALNREPITDTGDDRPSFESESQVNAMDEYKLFRKVCETLFDCKRFVELQRLTFSALGSPLFNRHPDIIKECEFLCLLSSHLNGDGFHAYNFCRELVVKDPKNNKAWNLFNLVITSTDDMRHNKFLMRLASKNPENSAMGLLNGHNSLLSGTYKYSLGEYMNAFKNDKSNPLTALMLGITFIHMACQKFSARKHSLVVQGCAFLQAYLKLRGSCQESYYNLGRAMHQLGIMPAAVHYYKKGLETEPSAKTSSVITDKSESNVFDLKNELAYNLSLIYQNSGSPELARYYTQKYVIV